MPPNFFFLIHFTLSIICICIYHTIHACVPPPSPPSPIPLFTTSSTSSFSCIVSRISRSSAHMRRGLYCALGTHFVYTNDYPSHAILEPHHRSRLFLHICIHACMYINRYIGMCLLFLPPLSLPYARGFLFFCTPRNH